MNFSWTKSTPEDVLVLDTVKVDDSMVCLPLSR
jgi:hypothetical protein